MKFYGIVGTLPPLLLLTWRCPNLVLVSLVREGSTSTSREDSRLSLGDVKRSNSGTVACPITKGYTHARTHARARTHVHNGTTNSWYNHIHIYHTKAVSPSDILEVCSTEKKSKNSSSTSSTETQRNELGRLSDDETTLLHTHT